MSHTSSVQDNFPTQNKMHVLFRCKDVLTKLDKSLRILRLLHPPVFKAHQSMTNPLEFCNIIRSEKTRIMWGYHSGSENTSTTCHVF